MVQLLFDLMLLLLSWRMLVTTGSALLLGIAMLHFIPDRTTAYFIALLCFGFGFLAGIYWEMLAEEKQGSSTDH